MIDDRFPAIARPVEKYSYVGRPLTPAIITHLAPALVTQSVFKRLQLIAVVEDYHVYRGGLESCQWPVVSAHGRPVSVPAAGIQAAGIFVAAYGQFFMAANRIAFRPDYAGEEVSPVDG